MLWLNMKEVRVNILRAQVKKLKRKGWRIIFSMLYSEDLSPRQSDSLTAKRRKFNIPLQVQTRSSRSKSVSSDQ